MRERRFLCCSARSSLFHRNRKFLRVAAMEAAFGRVAQQQEMEESRGSRGKNIREARLVGIR